MIYQIHRYPAELIDVVSLSAERIVIRPVLPQDEDLTSAFFRSLSPRSRHDRFMMSLREPPRDLMRRFTQIDYRDHLALVAEMFANGREIVIAEARYVRKPDPTVAEFAVSVAEPWQGKGLAGLLLAKLVCRAAVLGVERMVGETLASNARMLALARKAQFTIRPSGEVRGVMLLQRELSAPRVGQGCNAVDLDALAA